MSPSSSYNRIRGMLFLATLGIFYSSRELQSTADTYIQIYLGNDYTNLTWRMFNFPITLRGQIYSWSFICFLFSSLYTMIRIPCFALRSNSSCTGDIFVDILIYIKLYYMYYLNSVVAWFNPISPLFSENRVNIGFGFFE